MTIRFSLICELFERLELLQQNDPPLLKEHRVAQYQSTIQTWFGTYRSKLHTEDTDQAALLSTLLPHYRKDRSYGMQEDRLKHILPRILKLGCGRARILRDWKPEEDFATLVYRIQRPTDVAMLEHHVEVEEIDGALHDLAALSRWSTADVRASSGLHTKDSILERVISKLRATELKWFIRLIMKRIDRYIHDANFVLRMFHPLLPGLMRFQPDIGIMVKALQQPEVAKFGNTPGREDQWKIRQILARSLPPQIGIKISQPPFLKAHSIKNCLDMIGQGTWSIQEKLDGEYCQVHVDISNKQLPIKLFSKSGRDSTKDREAVMPWLIKALRISDGSCMFQKNCVLEGELVVWNSQNQSIQPFDRIRHHVSRAGSYRGRDKGVYADPHEHLVVFFYDLLVIDGNCIMFEDYAKRRGRLETLIRHIPQQVQKLNLVEPVNFSKISRRKAERLLLEQMVSVTTKRLEGLILKCCDMPYFSLESSSTSDRLNHCVVKLKKDYIKGLGDSEDFAIVGASFHEVDGPIYDLQKLKWTRFNLACLENKSEILESGASPVYKIVGTVGPKTMPLRLAEQISLDGPCRALRFEEHETHIAFRMNNSDLREPMTTVFREPFFAEVLGSGYEKSSSANYYMLRHPRVVKLRNEEDRSFRDIVSFDEMQNHARIAVNLPEDEKVEEDRWRQKIEEAARLRRTVYVNTTSPYTDKSESTVTPQTTPSKPTHAGTPSARIHTSVLIQSENQASKEGSQQRTTSSTTSRMTKMLMALPTPPASSAPAERRLAILGTTTPLRDAMQGRKRKRVDDEMTLSQQSTKRSCSSEPSPRRDSRLHKATTPRPPHRLPLTSSTPKPLADITNIPVNSASSRFTTKPLSVKIRFLTAAAKENAEPTYPVQSSPANGTTPPKVSEQDVTTSPTLNQPKQDGSSLQTLGRNEQDETDLRTTFDFSETDYPSSPPCQDPMTRTRPLVALTKPLMPRERPKTLTPFNNHIIFLAPCLCSYPYLNEDLMPMLSPDDVITNLKYWNREIEKGSQSGPTVSESQAYASLQKAVFVESRRLRATDEVLSQVSKLRLVEGESIEVWDWRIAESVVEHLESTQLDGFERKTRIIANGPRDELRACMVRYFIGRIRWDDDKKINVLDSRSRGEILDQYMDDFLGAD